MSTAFTIIPLAIEAKGEIITNNLPEFRELVREALANINRDLKTDEEFGQAELDVKALKEAEEAVRSAAIKAFDDQLKALVDGLNETAEEIRVPRLELEGLIKKRKEEVKNEIVEEFLAQFDIDPRDARKHFLAGLQTAIKGKRTLESMRTSCRIYQTSQQAKIIGARASIERFVTKFGAEMVMDRRELELKGREAVEAELVRRIEAKKAADERKRLEDEAAAARAETAKAQAALEAAKQPAKPAPLPEPPTGTAEQDSPPWGVAGNVVPFQLEAEPDTITEAQEWAEMTATVKAAFTIIKEHRDRLIHPANQAKMQSFAVPVNAVWATLKEEVAR